MSNLAKKIEKMGLSTMSLEFANSSDERAYIDDTREKEVEDKRLGIFVAIVLYIVFALVDYIWLPQSKYLTWFIRFGTFVPYAILMYALSFSEKFYKYFKFVVPSISTLSVIGYIVAMMFMPREVIGVYHFGVFVFFIYNLVFMSYQFLGSFYSMLIGYLSYLFYIYNYSGLIPQEIITATMMSTILFLLCLVGAYVFILQKKTYYYEIRQAYQKIDTSKSKRVFIEYEHQADEVSEVSEDYENENENVRVRNIENPINLLFESIDDVIWFANEDGIIKYISPSIKDFLGYEPEDLLDKRLSVILTKDSIDELEEGIGKLGIDRNKLHYVYQYKTKAGIVKYGDVFIKKYSDRRLGDGYCATTRHISEEKSQSLVVNENELDEIKQELHDNEQENIILQNEVVELQRKLVKMSEVEERKKPFPIDKIKLLLKNIESEIHEDFSKSFLSIIDNTLRLALKYEKSSMSKVDLEDYLKVVHKASSSSQIEAMKLTSYLNLYTLLIDDLNNVNHGKMFLKPSIERIVSDLDLYIKSSTASIGMIISEEDFIKFEYGIFEVLFKNLLLVYLEEQKGYESQENNLSIEIKYIEEVDIHELYIKSNVKLDIENIESLKLNEFIEKNKEFSRRMRIRLIAEVVSKLTNSKFAYENNDSGSLVYFGFSK